MTTIHRTRLGLFTLALLGVSLSRADSASGGSGSGSGPAPAVSPTPAPKAADKPDPKQAEIDRLNTQLAEWSKQINTLNETVKGLVVQRNQLAAQILDLQLQLGIKQEQENADKLKASGK